LVKTQEEEGEKGDKLIGFHRELGILLKGILRNSDLIALLSSGELAVIMPRLNFECLERLLERLEGEFSPEGSFKKCHAPLFGVSLVAPNMGLSPQGMMVAARESLQPIKGLKGYLKSQKKLIEGEETALKAEEKELLFQGFSNLWGRGRTS
jgi:GGDEF domain-containing protein